MEFHEVCFAERKAQAGRLRQSKTKNDLSFVFLLDYYTFAP